jgi:hypothetical protein
LRNKEQEKRLTLKEHDDDDDEGRSNFGIESLSPKKYFSMNGKN